MDIAYTNARIRGFRARLLDREDYRSLMEARSIEECLELLRAGYYGVDLDRASVRFKDAYQIIDHALTENTNTQIASLWKMIPERLHPHLRAFLYPWDGYNIKAIIRAIVKGADRDRLLDSLLPTGRLSQVVLRELATSHNLDELAIRLAMLREPLARVLKRALKTYRAHKSLFTVEFSIDKYVLTEPLKMLKGGDIDTLITRRVLAERIDAFNILTLFKIHREDYREEEIEPFFIEGGRNMGKELFKRLATIKEREELFKELVEGIKGRTLKELFSPLYADQPWILEEKLEELRMRRLLREAVKEPLSIALLLEYVYRKLREVKNIRLILRGKMSGMPESKIREAFIEPWQA